jgi:rhamnogalacturonyl hydrolase YesR
MHSETRMDLLSRRRFLAAAGGLVAVVLSPGCVCLRKPSSAALAMGKRVANYTTAHQLDSVNYPTVCCAYGLLLFAQATGDRTLEARVEKVYEAYLSGEKDPARDMNGRKLEHRWFGIIPLQLGVNRKAAYRTVAKSQADLQVAEPAKDSDVYYVDAMYGVGSLQAKAFLHLHDPKYAERCLAHLLVHLRTLQQPNGLFHHSERGRQAWGRGNGWAAASLTEALLALPASYPGRNELFQSWRRLMEALVQHQAPQGLWRQIVDLPSSWLETSGTAMFVFALAMGIRERWLPEKPYRQAMERGWQALAASVDGQGRLAEVCIGLGDNPGTEAHYLSCPRKLADKHGQGPFLWAAAAMLRV